jgi:hypothetical protein
LENRTAKMQPVCVEFKVSFKCTLFQVDRTYIERDVSKILCKIVPRSWYINFALWSK